MRTKLSRLLPEHDLVSIACQNIFIVDYKDFDLGGVQYFCDRPETIKSIHLENIQQIEICFDGFKENALPLPELGKQSRQCECVLFPETCDDEDWILFIEAKYANDRAGAFNIERDYPNCMVNQIIETVKYFRERGIISQEKRVHAIVSFPNLIEEFNSTMFNGSLSVLDIVTQYKIIIRATNSAQIKSKKRIMWNSI